MPDLFKEVLPSILRSKKDQFPDGDMKDYNPFMINRALSMYRDTVLYANEMNMRHHLDKRMQYEYLMKSIRSMSRPWMPWPKKPKLDDLELVKEAFDYNDKKAIEALGLLSEGDLKRIRAKLDTGGLGRAKV